jgi:hypothetical protein
MASKYGDALVPKSAGRPCPVCGKPSYSRFGIHPQCSLKQADDKTADRLREKRKADELRAAAAAVQQ